MSYETLFVHQLQSELKRQQFAILDMRDQNSYEREHIEGAERVDDDVIKKVLRERKKDEPILIYCYHGNSSRDLASFFTGLGFSRVFNLEGGWQAWNNFIATSETETISSDDTEITNWLLFHKFKADDLNHRVHNGMTALMTAALQGEEKIVESLLESGCDVNQVNDDENNALWFAAVSENIEIVNCLLKAGIHIDNANINGATTLIYATSSGKFTVVKTLVEAGADILHVTPDGFNALDLASSLSIMNYLKPKFTQH